jgi:hypothetical protein
MFYWVYKQISQTFADDTQLFNKNYESVKKCFDILSIYGKGAYGSKINYEKIGKKITDLSLQK